MSLGVNSNSVNINHNWQDLKNHKEPFNGYHIKIIKDKQPEASEKVKRGVALTTGLGILAGLAVVLKRQKISINPKKMFSGPIKNWALAKVKYNDWKDIVILASGSITGGLVGGAIFDKKENMKAKYRESIIQMLGNILTPLACVAGGMGIFEKHESNIINHFGLKGNMKKLPNILATGACLAAGIILGNRVSNFINEEIYNIKDDRGVKVADMSGHVDDVCLALTLSNPNNVVVKGISRFIPLALSVCGYSSGVMQEWPDDMKEKRRAKKPVA